MLDHNLDKICPERITVYGDIFLEKMNSTLSLSKSEFCLKKSFAGGTNGRIRLATDLKMANLKKSQVGLIEGIICEAFNLITQEIILNLADSSNQALTKMPTTLSRTLDEEIDCHRLYRLNLPNGFCHCVLELKTGDVT
jgi:hypothetical protein